MRCSLQGCFLKKKRKLIIVGVLQIYSADIRWDMRYVRRLFLSLRWPSTPFFCTLSSKVFEGWVMGEKKKKKESNGAHQQKKKNIGYGLVPLDRRQQETKEEEEPQVGSDKEEKWWAPVVSRSTSRLKQCELVTMIISDGVLGEGGGGWGCGWGGHTADRISYILCLLKFKTTKIWKLQFQTKQRKDV